MRRLAQASLIAGLLWFATLPARAEPAAASMFADWAALVVAGDFHDHDGKPTEGFDNARRDVAKTLVSAGFAPANVRQFSVRPERYKDRPARSDPDTIFAGLVDSADKARGGCLVYFTSHGTPEGVVLGEEMLVPGVLAAMLDQACAGRPTVAVISACFSGVFIPALSGGQRMVLTAARPDRTSFGCGQDDKYPYFDECFIETASGAADLKLLSEAVKSCVAAREQKEGMKPPSEPQVFIGGGLRPLLPLYRLTTGPPAR